MDLEKPFFLFCPVNGVFIFFTYTDDNDLKSHNGSSLSWDK